MIPTVGCFILEIYGFGRVSVKCGLTRALGILTVSCESLNKG